MCESSTLMHSTAVVGGLNPHTKRGRGCRENSDVEEPKANNIPHIFVIKKKKKNMFNHVILKKKKPTFHCWARI